MGSLRHKSRTLRLLWRMIRKPFTGELAILLTSYISNIGLVKLCSIDILWKRMYMNDWRWSSCLLPSLLERSSARVMHFGLFIYLSVRARTSKTIAPIYLIFLHFVRSIIPVLQSSSKIIGIRIWIQEFTKGFLTCDRPKYAIKVRHDVKRTL